MSLGAVSTINQVAGQLAGTLSKQTIAKMAEAVISQNIPVKQLINLTFDPNKKVGWRAAWVLEIIAFKHFDIFISEIDYFLSRFPEVNNAGARRHYSKILHHILTLYSKYPCESEHFWDSNLEPVVEACFDWLINPAERVAVKAHCMDCLYYLSDKYTWVSEELIPTMRLLQNDGTPGILSRAKKIIQKQELRNLRP